MLVVSVTLLLTAASGCDDDDDTPPNQPPVADMRGPSSGGVTEVLAFDASNSTDDRGGLSFHWVWGDGATGTGAVATHSYQRPGTYTIVLTVTDGEGLSDTALHVVTVGWNVTITLSSPTVWQMTRTVTCWDAEMNVDAVNPAGVQVPWADLRVSVISTHTTVLLSETALAKDEGAYSDPATPEAWFSDVTDAGWVQQGDAIRLTGMDASWEGATVSLMLDGELVVSIRLPTDFP